MVLTRKVMVLSNRATASTQEAGGEDGEDGGGQSKTQTPHRLEKQG